MAEAKEQHKGGWGFLRSRLIARYILSEMIPGFFLGVLIFVLILLMFQALRLTEFVLVHGVKVSTCLELVGYMSTSFLPVLFPMSLLLTVLITYSRMNSDSEIIAMRSLGLNLYHILFPAFLLSLLVAYFSAQTAFHLAPWGNRRFEVLFTELGSSKPAIAIKEGMFAEGFFDLVLYANKVDSQAGRLHHVFVFDERDPQKPVTVIAQDGLIQFDSEHPGHQAVLQLTDGDIHQSTSSRHTQIHFKSYELRLNDPMQKAFKAKSLLSYTLDDINQALQESNRPAHELLAIRTEWHKRVAIIFACILFALLGVGMGIKSDRRSGKASGLAISLGLIVTYWALFVGAESLARNGKLPPAVALWIPNALFAISSWISLRKAWN